MTNIIKSELEQVRPSKCVSLYSTGKFEWQLALWLRNKDKQIINDKLSNLQDELISCSLIAAVSTADGTVPEGTSTLILVQYVLKLLVEKKSKNFF